MTSEELFNKIENIVVWKKGSQRAPHKPLLILLAIGYLQRQEKRLISYKEIDEDLKKLLKVFGPSRTSYHPEYPFWRLQKDGIWELENAENVEARKSNSDAKKSELLKYGVKGGFTTSIYEILQADKKLTSKVIDFVLDSHFETTLHDDIIQSIGLLYDNTYQYSKEKKRDPKFRELVLRKYKYKCSICGFDLKYDNKPVGIEAAHIQWHTHGGPNKINNGIALCAQHHSLFDYGVLTITNDYKLMISSKIDGSQEHQKIFLNPNLVKIELPTFSEDRPSKDYLNWHYHEVFKKY